jgi:uncharacterized protein YbjT (DUF2867 family)
MFIILGGTGHVGSATATELLKDRHSVTIVTRDRDKAEPLRHQGAKVAIADLYDVDAMRTVFRSGKRLFLLNPPPAPDTDTDRTEKDTIRHLLSAIDGSGIEKIVAESTYGAQPGDEIGDLNTLYAMEQGLHGQAIPHSIIRAAYYMSNWDMMVEPARNNGILPTMYPSDLDIPMVAPADLGKVAARLLTEPLDRTGTHYVEGPESYSSGDVAVAFSQALGRPVQPVVTPRDQWEMAYRKLGFSEAAARSYTRMTAISVDGKYDTPNNPIRGSTTLQAYVDSLVSAA